MSTRWALAFTDFVVVMMCFGERPPRRWAITIAIIFAVGAVANALIALGVIHP